MRSEYQKSCAATDAGERRLVQERVGRHRRRHPLPVWLLAHAVLIPARGALQCDACLIFVLRPPAIATVGLALLFPFC